MVTKLIIAFFLAGRPKATLYFFACQIVTEADEWMMTQRRMKMSQIAKMIFKRCTKKTHQKSHRRGKKVCFFTAQLSLSFSGGKRVGRPERLFCFPTFLFPTRFPSPCAVSLTAYVRWVLNMASDFFFFQLLSTRVFAFWQLAAQQPHWTLIQLELNWTFPGWIEPFSWMNWTFSIPGV